MPPRDDVVKQALVDAIEAHLRWDAGLSALDCEVQRVDKWNILFRVKKEGRLARYFNVKISEVM